MATWGIGERVSPREQAPELAPHAAATLFQLTSRPKIRRVDLYFDKFYTVTVRAVAWRLQSLCSAVYEAVGQNVNWHGLINWPHQSTA